MDIDLRLIFQKMIRIFVVVVVVIIIIQQDEGLVLLSVCLQRGRRRMNRGMRVINGVGEVEAQLNTLCGKRTEDIVADGGGAAHSTGKMASRMGDSSFCFSTIYQIHSVEQLEQLAVVRLESFRVRLHHLIQQQEADLSGKKDIHCFFTLNLSITEADWRI
ncbi:hypothetical protein EYF80_005145 [Liparis tanakae]|uniref:Uncharacterized protein n=1 Tax=Liparis tanakae TaxID=230148 RepID=A0A4Z2J3E3_9TELE|nr:hypothetical protein EYF80_005145 [Liparis tanakae]